MGAGQPIPDGLLAAVGVLILVGLAHLSILHYVTGTSTESTQVSV